MIVDGERTQDTAAGSGAASSTHSRTARSGSLKRRTAERRGTAAPTLTITGRMTDPKYEAANLLIDCDRCARYHAARGDFINKCHKWMMVAVLFSSSSAVVALSEMDATVAIFIMLVPALIGAIEVVWGLTEMVRRHESMVRRFHEIASEIDVQSAAVERVREWDDKVRGVYGEAPLSVYHALNAVCGNAAYQAAGRDPNKFQRIGRWQYRLRNWVKYTANDFPRRDQARTI